MPASARILALQQDQKIRSAAEVRQDQAEQVQGMALQMPAEQQQFAERCGKRRNPDGHDVFEGLQGG